MMVMLRSCAFLGIEAFCVEVEVDISSGQLPSYNVVGLAHTSVREGAVRIRAALKHLGESLPRKKVTVNLAPADKKKEGAAFDLPIALCILAAEEKIELEELKNYLVLGELGLDGSLRPIRGALSAALLAKELGLKGIILPLSCADEAMEVHDLEVIPCRNLPDAIEFVREGRVIDFCRRKQEVRAHSFDMSDVRGQETARMAMEVAVAGGHNLLFVGPPGIGKTMLARRIPSILPPLTREEALESTRIYSSLSLNEGLLVQKRPFRAPHHSITAPALIGGGSPPVAGEVSLAHNGVLFLDEMPEFKRGVLESLRQPLEDRKVTIGRVRGRIELPASFLLAASANPCPCGWLGAEGRECICTVRQIARYRGRFSGPLLDRMDLQVCVHNPRIEELRSKEGGENSQSIRERVLEARHRQYDRLAEFGCRSNAEMDARTTRKTCVLTSSAEEVLTRIHRMQPGMSGRAVDRIVRVARTIADLCGSDMVDSGCILEASSYRSLDFSESPMEPLSRSSPPPTESISVSANAGRST